MENDKLVLTDLEQQQRYQSNALLNLKEDVCYIIQLMLLAHRNSIPCKLDRTQIWQLI